MSDARVLSPRKVNDLIGRFCTTYPDSRVAGVLWGIRSKDVFRMGPASDGFQAGLIDDIAMTTDVPFALELMAVWVQIWHVNMRQTRITRNSVRSALLVLSNRAGQHAAEGNVRRHNVEVMMLEYLIALEA